MSADPVRRSLGRRQLLRLFALAATGAAGLSAVCTAAAPAGPGNATGAPTAPAPAAAASPAAVPTIRATSAPAAAAPAPRTNAGNVLRVPLPSDTPTTWLYGLLHSKSPTNFVNWANPAYDRLVDEARVTAGDAKRTALYRQAEQLALDEAVLGPVNFPLNTYLVKPYVSGLDFNVTGPAAYYAVELKR